MDRIELLIREGVRVASFALAPKPELIARLKEAGVVVIPSVGAAKHAKKVAGWGADAVIVQGGEGGGHTGPVATTLLLPSVLDALKGTSIPVVAAGGFFDGRGLAAALSYGAAGVAMGTRFLLTSDSTVPEAVIRLTAAQNCWVGLNSTSGHTLYQGLVLAGSTKTWNEKDQVSLVIGNPPGITLTVNGKTQKLSKGQVARLNINPSSKTPVQVG